MCMISIIVPVYNMEKYIEECLKSILQQTYLNYEVILVDDGSTDNSGIICDEYQKRYEKVTVLHKKNGGVSSARNLGIDVAQGKYLMFVDCDDRIHPQICYFFEKLAEEENADIVIGKSKEGYYNGHKFSDNIKNCKYKTLVEKSERLKKIYVEDKYKYWTAWCKLYRKELFYEYRFEEGRAYEDNGLIFKLLYSANKVIDIDEYFYFYSVNETGITKSSFCKKHMDVLWAYEMQIEFFEEHSDMDMMRVIICKYLSTCADFYYKCKDLLKDNNEAHELKTKLKRGIKKWKYKFDLRIREIPNVYKILFPFKYYPYAFIVKLKRRLSY